MTATEIFELADAIHRLEPWLTYAQALDRALDAADCVANPF